MPMALKNLLSCTLLAASALLAGCAMPITAKVTTFSFWPQDAAGATFSYVPPPETKAGELEQLTYETYVRAELERLGLKYVKPDQKPRFLAEVGTTGTTRERKFLEPVYSNQLIFLPPYRDPYGNVFPGYWAPDQFGSRYVGDREVTRTVQVSRMKVRLLDNQAGTAGKPRAVFESTAVYEGDNEDLPDLVPYLTRAVFDGFPGQNGKVRQVKFDTQTGQVKPR
jgi:hypothetical protein